MPEIYSNPAGPTPQANGLQTLGNSLSSITGNPALASYTNMAANYQPYMSNVKQSLTQQSGIPTLTSQYADQSKLLDMFALDQSLAQKYGQSGTSGNIPKMVNSMTITRGGQPPTLSQESLSSGFQGELGSMDPSTLIGLMGGSTKGNKDMLNLIKSAIDYQAGNVTKQTQADAEAYKSVMDAYSKLADEYTKQKQIEAQYGTGSDADLEVDAYIEQIKGGLKISSIPVNIRTKVIAKLSSLGLTPEKIQKEAQGLRIISDMADMKTKWDQIGKSPFGESPLSVILGKGTKALAEWGIGPQAALIKSYSDKRSAMVSSLRDLMKEKGNMSNQDMMRLEKILVDFESTPLTQEIKWEDIRNVLENVYGKDYVNSLWPKTSKTTSGLGEIPRLKDPQTGKVYEYDSKSDPDYINDLNNGFLIQ